MEYPTNKAGEIYYGYKTSRAAIAGLRASTQGGDEYWAAIAGVVAAMRAAGYTRAAANVRRHFNLEK